MVIRSFYTSLLFTIFLMNIHGLNPCSSNFLKFLQELLDSELKNVDIVIEGSSFYSECNLHVLRSVPQTNFSTFLVKNSNNDRKIKRSLISSNNSPTHPTMWLYPNLNNTNFNLVLEHIINFYDDDPKARKWNPIFLLFLELPISWNEEDTNKNTSAFQWLRKLTVFSEVYIVKFIMDGDEQNYINMKVYEVYSIRDHLIHRTFLVRNSQEFYKLIQHSNRRRANFEKSTVIAIGDDDPEYPLATKFKIGTNDLESGFEVEIYRYMRDSLNFTESAIKGTDYIKEGPGGTLLGVAQQVKQDGDIIIGAYEFLEYRFRGPDGITYIHPSFYTRVQAFFVQPSSGSMRDIYLQAFTKELWAVSLFSWALIYFGMRLFKRSSKKVAGNKITQDDYVIGDESFVWIIGTICQKSWYYTPFSKIARLIFFTGILLGFILFIAFSSTLVSVLSVKDIPIQVFQDLLDYDYFIASDLHTPTSKALIRVMEEQNMLPKIENPESRYIDVSHNLQNLANSKFAILTAPDVFYPILQQHNFTEQQICLKISSTVVTLRTTLSSCAVKRGSPLRKLLNYKMTTMIERGIRHRIVRKYIWITSVRCLRESEGNISGEFDKSISLLDILTAHIFYVVGVLFSLISLLTEKVMFHMKSQAQATIH